MHWTYFSQSTLEEISTNDLEDDGLSIVFNKDDGVVIKLPDESDESIIKRVSTKAEYETMSWS